MSNLTRVISFLLRMSRSVRRARATFVLIVVLGVIGGLCNTGLLALINAKLYEGRTTSTLLVAAFVGLCVLTPLSRFLSGVLLLALTQKSIHEVRMQLSRSILSAPMRHLEKFGPHRLLAVLTDDVGTITAALVSIPLLCMQAAIVVGCLSYLGWLYWPGLLLVLGFMVVGILSYQLPMIKAGAYYNLARNDWDTVFKGFTGLTEGTKELKLHHRRRRDFLEREMEQPSLTLQRHGWLAGVITTAAISWGQILFFVLLGVILFVLSERQGLDRETLSGYTLTILYLIGPLEVLLNMLPQYGRARAAVDQVERLGLSFSQAGKETDAEGDAPPWRELSLVGVTHTYYREGEDGQFMLGPIDLSLTPGELIFLIGGNGSGKTTLAKLLLGLYAPEAGEVRLDGVPVDAESRDRYRQLFAVVFTDFFLFESLLGLSSPELDAEAKKYLRQLQLDRKVEVSDGRLSTTELSQGQRKRLALLTAYLEDRPIYLFDEWAADQDPLFKNIFYLQILPELKARGKTVIVISHDDRYYHLADRILKLDYGKLEFDRSRLDGDWTSGLELGPPAAARGHTVQKGGLER